MIPTPDTTHVADGLALLMGQYASATNLRGLLQAGLEEVQDAEDSAWGVIYSKILAMAPTGQALYQLADLVKCPRAGLSDAQLLFFLGIWLLALRSKGLSENILRILAKAFPGVMINYEELYPLAYQAWLLDVPDPSLIVPLLQALKIARPPTVNAVIGWSSWPTTQTFFYGGYGVAGTGYASPYGSTPYDFGYLMGDTE
jgi:hypothetical protein